MIYNNKNIGKVNLLNAVNMDYITKIKDPKVYKLIFTHFFLKINPKHIFQDYLVDKNNWKTGLFTDGYNTVSLDRRKLYNTPIAGYLKCNNSIILQYPDTIRRFLLKLS